MQTGTLLQELQEEENKFESVGDRSKTATTESSTDTGEGLLLKTEINIQAQPSEEIKKDVKIEKKSFLQTRSNLFYLDNLESLRFNETSIEQLSSYKKIQSEAIRIKTIDNILLGLSFGGGIGILLTGIIFANGFLSWIGAILMVLGFIHLKT